MTSAFLILALVIGAYVVHVIRAELRKRREMEQQDRRARIEANRKVWLTAEEERAWKRIQRGYKQTADGDNR